MKAKSKSQFRWTLCHCTLPPAEKNTEWVYWNANLCSIFYFKPNADWLTDWWTQSLERPFRCLGYICFFALFVNVPRFFLLLYRSMFLSASLLFFILYKNLDFIHLTASPGWGGCSAETWPVTRHLRYGGQGCEMPRIWRMYPCKNICRLG